MLIFSEIMDEVKIVLVLFPALRIAHDNYSACSILNTTKPLNLQLKNTRALWTRLGTVKSLWYMVTLNRTDHLPIRQQPCVSQYGRNT